MDRGGIRAGHAGGKEDRGPGIAEIIEIFFADVPGAGPGQEPKLTSGAKCPHGKAKRPHGKAKRPHGVLMQNVRAIEANAKLTEKANFRGANFAS